MIEPRQIRAARALLNWSQSDLAKASGVATSSIKNIENEITVARRDTIDDITKAFEENGIEFGTDGGVRPRRPEAKILTGKKGFREFYDLVYSAMQKGGEILISGVEENKISHLLGEYADFHRKRMGDIKERVNVKCLLKEGDTDFAASTYCEYRWTKKEYVESTLFYVFNFHVALITFLEDDDVYIIIFDIPKLADFYKVLFKKLWDEANETNILKKK